MAELLATHCQIIAAAPIRWRPPIEAALAPQPHSPAAPQPYWCDSVYQALAEAVVLNRQDLPAVLCVMVDHLAPQEMQVFARLAGMDNVRIVIACAASARTRKLPQAQALGADEAWLLTREPPTGLLELIRTAPEEDLAPPSQPPPETPLPEAPPPTAQPNVQQPTDSQEPPQPDSPQEPNQPLISKEELDALLG